MSDPLPGPEPNGPRELVLATLRFLPFISFLSYSHLLSHCLAGAVRFVTTQLGAQPSAWRCTGYSRPNLTPTRDPCIWAPLSPANPDTSRLLKKLPSCRCERAAVTRPHHLHPVLGLHRNASRLDPLCTALRQFIHFPFAVKLNAVFTTPVRTRRAVRSFIPAPKNHPEPWRVHVLPRLRTRGDATADRVASGGPNC